MHTLSRQVRFSVSPFLPAQPEGYNSYASKPTGEGLSIYLSIWIELEGTPDPQTGFIVNVSEIDKVLRRDLVPLFTDKIQTAFNDRKHLSTRDLALILIKSDPLLSDTFKKEHYKVLRSIKLELNPYRSISIYCGSRQSQVKGMQMFTYTEKFEFSAMHKLWNDAFSQGKNMEVFGKCANPAGHGHNYILEAAVEVPQGLSNEGSGWEVDFQKAVKEKFLDLVDHKNLNCDIPAFKANPTVENIVSFAWQCLCGQFEGVNLRKLTVWENDRTYCTYCKD